MLAIHGAFSIRKFSIKQFYPLFVVKKSTYFAPVEHFGKYWYPRTRHWMVFKVTMTNVTISISTSQIFRSWVAIFQPRPPMASLFRSLYGMPGLAPRMDVLSWGRRDFQISFSNRDTLRNAWNRHWGSFMVDTGILSNNMKFPSHKC